MFMKLSDLLKEKNIYIPLPCGGLGACGKCKVKLTNGEVVLACKYEVEKDFDVTGVNMIWNNCEISAVSAQIDGCVTDTSVVDDEIESGRLKEDGHNSRKKLGIAIDLGTTTLAFALVNNCGDIVVTFTSENHQRSYGADVISRIKAANEGDLLTLKSIIAKDLNIGVKRLLAKKQCDIEDVELITIAGNTTMIHLLMGYSCEGLGKFPFIPETLDEINTDTNSLFSSQESNIKVKIMPGISAFVGGDILSGIYELDINMEKTPILFIDLGTNGEMVIGNRYGLLTTSTAAGPAFEGGKISCGVPSISGAIYDIEIQSKGRRIKYSTIDGKIPVGICGTGLISLIYELRKNEIVDENGNLIDEYFEHGFEIAKGIKITQQDIREFQMAKSAIRAGIEMLLKEFVMEAKDFETVYLAGGFGQFLNISKATAIGLLPSNVSCEIKSVGNTSLKGGIKYLKESLYSISDDVSPSEKLENIKKSVKEIVLGGSVEFNSLYMKYLNL